MPVRDENAWTELRPALRSPASREDFTELGTALVRAARRSDDDGVGCVRRAFISELKTSRRGDRQALLAAGLVLGDLCMQGWNIRVRQRRVEVKPPTQVLDDRASEKTRIRRQELVKRDAQLRTPSVQRFIKAMERPRVFDGAVTSIFSLMRDGRELADRLREAREHHSNGWADALAACVDPYIEFVSSEDSFCRFTGLRLMDVWRYFRHTWTNQYSTVPGRTMQLLIRDRAARFHPVVGIASLSSPVMQIRERDNWVGWHPEPFIARVRTAPTNGLARWLVTVVDTAISEVYADDLIEDGVLSARHLAAPDATVLERLLAESTEQRRLHHRYVRSRDHKIRATDASSDHWVARARTHLFRSKRALALYTYLRARMILQKYFGRSPTAKKLGQLASSSEGTEVIRRILKKAKADRVGIAVADITVCGAVQPYNAILGGKLVAMLVTSPEVAREYRRRYATAESEIASSMAGRPITREPNLVLLGTTSLYGTGSSQYNRIKIPCSRVGGSPGETVRYEELGHSESFGTSQYSEETVAALADLVQQSTGGQRVNSIFGEGVSPKLRKVRQGLDLLKLPAGLLLKHHRRRVVYGVSLVRNLGDYLLGLQRRPSYLVPTDEQGAAVTGQIVAWWRERWLRNRINSDDVLEEVARHTHVRPIQHGARVILLAPADQRSLFSEVQL